MIEGGVADWGGVRETGIITCVTDKECAFGEWLNGIVCKNRIGMVAVAVGARQMVTPHRDCIGCWCLWALGGSLTQTRRRRTASTHSDVVPLINVKNHTGYI